MIPVDKGRFMLFAQSLGQETPGNALIADRAITLTTTALTDVSVRGQPASPTREAERPALIEPHLALP